MKTSRIVLLSAVLVGLFAVAQKALSQTTMLRTQEDVMKRVPSDPDPANATVNLLFVEGDKNGNFAEFTGSGTVANGKLTGTGSCSPNTPICQGASATFSGNQQ